MSSQTLSKCWCGIRHQPLSVLDRTDPDYMHHKHKLVRRRMDEQNHALMMHLDTRVPAPVDDWLNARIGSL